nr:probable G-protein coupled receptor B0563.6 [Procambarus clarkii]XP_045585264.1 probable G-protein coupled receptor B0563.6 [Procambarus clarkii]XP_045585265.1 probable G-protein coupled receptor B0563.6 [Procambarus clarkii]XP_045585266.1 probable G-protein coupled receptor B0563.6 [Procambarus clarkii]
MGLDTGVRWFQNQENNTIDTRIVEVHYLAYGIVSPIIISAGIVGNLLTILILWNPKFRGVTYKYFVILAASDLIALLCSISVFVHIVQEATRSYTTAVWYSYLENYFVNVPMSTSVFTVVCVTVDRFYSICRPAKFSTIHSPKFAYKALFLTFVVSAVVWLPVCFLKTPVDAGDCESSYFEPPDDDETWWVACMRYDTLAEPWYLMYSWSRQTIVTFIPIVVITVLNAMTIRSFIRLSKRRKEMIVNSVLGSSSQNASTPGEGKMVEESNLVYLLSAVVLTFFITMVPVGIFNAMYTDYLSSAFKYEVFRALANDLEILNHALNFYMYILCSSQIRLTCRTFVSQCASAVYSFLQFTFLVFIKRPVRSPCTPGSCV